jgi:hypothetical protein
LFNALVWLTFPTTKAVINARHYESMVAAGRGNRPPQRDALTLFDEDGVAVVSTDAELLDLVRGFRWKELFWNRRDAVKARMRFYVFGHALFSKALHPFVGLTGKAVLLQVPGAFLELSQASQLAELDRRLSIHVWNRERFRHGRELSPLPVLGVPGWWSGNERKSSTTIPRTSGRDAVSLPYFPDRTPRGCALSAWRDTWPCRPFRGLPRGCRRPRGSSPPPD